jgi:hypothetical protein
MAVEQGRSLSNLQMHAQTVAETRSIASDRMLEGFGSKNEPLNTVEGIPSKRMITTGAKIDMQTMSDLRVPVLLF